MNNDELKYYYKDSKGQSQGGITKEELRKLKLNPDTLIWHKGLSDWVTYSSLFPCVKSMKKGRWILWLVGSIAVIGIILLVLLSGSFALHARLKNNSYASDEFDMYINKYYRDLEVFGISVVKSRSVSIRFAPMQYFEDTKDFYGLAYGGGDDDRIEIYINEDGWKKLTRAQKYLLMYHELSHDILNVDDLPDSPSNYSKLMCPILDRYERFTMDDFIEISHDFFIEHSPIYSN